MSDVSILTERDRQLVEAGYLPIDIDPARPLTNVERDRMSSEQRSRIFAVERLGYEAIVHKGYLGYRRRPDQFIL